uniref:Fidgetin, microtubule severing factor n=1 Tax=Equus caballus TaxID=9796 RepID=A0A9L0S9H5_HORSE
MISSTSVYATWRQCCPAFFIPEAGGRKALW